MIVGVPREIKVHEYRVGLTPNSTRELTAHGHKVIVETGAGNGIGCPDGDYIAAGAEIAANAHDVYGRAEMIVKVKEPQPDERKMLREGQIIFAYLHLAPDPQQTSDLVACGAICIAYETVSDGHGGLPLLAPMSQVAGRLSIQAGAHCLERENGGKGILLGGVPGVPPGKVVVLGGGIVGENAILMALGMGASVTVLDRKIDVLSRLARQFGPALKTAYSSRAAVEQHVLDADLVVGAVLVVGAEAPKLVSADVVRRMRPGTVLVDVSIDQGGCFETSRPTTHADPTYMLDGVVHYCVSNMPGAVPITSTNALNNVTLPYALTLADHGYKKALVDDRSFREGLNICKGRITHQAVARDLRHEYVDPEKALDA
ncbi:MAG: alanine dehydrogenase [Vicinamibacteria bacterium]|nr:alanine dehydrogenase [Vicinamibacteria bacterium]